MSNENKNVFESKRKTTSKSELSIKNEFKLLFKGKSHEYEIFGKLSNDVTDMTVMVVAMDAEKLKRHRRKVNLFNQAHLLNLCDELAIEMDVDAALIERDLTRLTDLLEEFRDNEFNTNNVPLELTKHRNPLLKKTALSILNDKDILKRIGQLLESVGIIGEEKMRLALFIIATTYKTKTPLHAIVQGATGTGKSHLINSVAACMPQEDVLSLSRITGKSLFHYHSNQLQNKLLDIQDFDGLEGTAQYALRELQSAQQISSSSTKKDRFGNLVPSFKILEASFASLMATTRPEIYADNMSRSIVLGVDESDKQTERILFHQSKLFAGVETIEKQEESKNMLRILVELLLPRPVINHFAEQIILPLKIASGRRLHHQFSILINQITFIKQFQRKADEAGRLITTKEDLIDAVHLFADMLVAKSDQLDPSTRQFFDSLKNYLKSREDNQSKHFTTREIRQHFSYGKTQIFRYIEILKANDFVTITGGSVNRGFVYTVTNWDNSIKDLDQLKKDLLEQIEQIDLKKINPKSV